jgi:nitrogen fixation NifU-like protein
VFVALDGDRLAAVSFVAAGCSILTAAASMMTERLRGAPRAEARSLADRFQALVRQPPDAPAQPDAAGTLGALAVFAAVRAFPGRHQCAVLPWRTMLTALNNPDPFRDTDQPPPAEAAPRPAT